MSQYQNNKYQIRIPIIIALALSAGLFVGATFFGNSNQNTADDMTRNFIKFREVINYLNRDYVDTININELTDYSITKMLEKLDPHSVYIPAKEVELAKAPLEGDFDGIGIEFFLMKDTIEVVTPLSGGPSESVGLRAGDKIIKVNDTVVAGTNLSNRDVFKLLRGKKGTKVRVAVQRRGQKDLIDFVITRDKIPQHSVDVAYMVDATTGYIKVNRFAANTYDEFAESLNKLKSQGMQRLMIDLRDNPGGYMDRAVKMVDELLPNGRKIVYTKSKDGRFNNTFNATSKGVFEKGPVVVLINEGSASASEIVSGALQDNDRGLIVGRRSFGKGLVQMPIDLSDGSEIRLTISRYYTPSGRSIQKHYDLGKGEDYENDMTTRYLKGEFYHVDSIKFADSLKFATKNGRVVYGGGGIMPDVFVPLDTMFSSPYLGRLYGKNILREFALNYVNDNKRAWSKKSFEEFNKDFVVTDAMEKKLIALATKEGLEYNDTQYQRSRETIRNVLKAFIARGYYKEQGFYPVIHQQDEIFKAAYAKLDEAKKLEAMR